MTKTYEVVHDAAQMVSVPGPLQYAADGLFTRHHPHFLKDRRFHAAYEAGISTIRHRRPGLRVEWRVHTALWVASQAIRLDGDFVECGVFTGIFSRALIEYLNFAQYANKKLWLLDTFEGIPDESLTEAERALRHSGEASPYYSCLDEVRRTFAPFANVHIVPGVVPHTLSQVTSERIAYLSIDMNAAKPEIDAAEHFWPRMLPGAMMLLDDYGWRTCEEQARAFDDFAHMRKVEILRLPTGQAIIMKPLA